MSDVAPEESGLASGRRQHRVHDGRSARPRGAREPGGGPHRQPARRRRARSEALNGGYHAAFVAGACFALAGAILSAVLLRADVKAPAGHEGQERVEGLKAVEAE